MKFDVVALGEMLIDFTLNGYSSQNNEMFEANPGGAPCNVLAMLEKLGKKTAFIGKVGDDMFGKKLKETASSCGINVDSLILDPTINTTLAFVHTKPDGDRDFSFYRNPGADELLSPDEINADTIKNAKIFHFGSLSLTREPVRSATRRAIEIAKESNIMISFDPNLRPPLWPNFDDAYKQISWGCSQCDIIKVSDEELEFITKIKDQDEAITAFREKFPNIKIVFLTKGKEGSEAYYEDIHLSVSSFTGVKTIDTTGAGDTFCGNCLSFIIDEGIDNLTEESIKKMLVNANAAAALVTAKKGAILSMPSTEEINELISSSKNS